MFIGATNYNFDLFTKYKLKRLNTDAKSYIINIILTSINRTKNASCNHQVLPNKTTIIKYCVLERFLCILTLYDTEKSLAVITGDSAMSVE